MGDCVWYWLSTWRAARHQKSECDSHLTKVTAWVQTTSPCDWWALRLVESELAVESEFVMMDWGTHESLKKSGIGSKKWRTMKLTAKSFISHSQHSWSSTETQSWLCWPKTSYPFKVANITSAASGGHGKRLNIFLVQDCLKNLLCSIKFDCTHVTWHLIQQDKVPAGSWYLSLARTSSQLLFGDSAGSLALGIFTSPHLDATLTESLFLTAGSITPEEHQ